MRRRRTILTAVAAMCACALAASLGGASALLGTAGASAFPGTNGKLMYTKIAGSGQYLVTVQPNGTGQRQITDPQPPLADFAARFSANGKKIVFVRVNRNTGSEHLVVAKANGSNARILKVSGLPKNTFVNWPTFSADGTKIAFELDGRTSAVGIYQVKTDGSHLRLLLKGHYSQPTFSPNGTQMAFVSGNHILEVASTNGGAPTPLYTAGATSSVGSPEFSPDGTQIVFTLFAEAAFRHSNILSVPTAGGTETHLTNYTRDTFADNAAYAPDGTKIAFWRERPGVTSIVMMSPTGANKKSILTARNGSTVLQPDWQCASNCL